MLQYQRGGERGGGRGTSMTCCVNRTAGRPALIFGHPERDTWTVRAAMGRDPDDPKGFRERVVAEEEGGKACETRFRVVQRGVLTLEGKYKVGVVRVDSLFDPWIERCTVSNS